MGTESGAAIAARAAASAASRAQAEIDGAQDAARPTAVRLNSREYEYLKSVFETKGKGLKLSTGIKMAALWIAERVEDGAMSISRAGVTDKRR